MILYLKNIAYFWLTFLSFSFLSLKERSIFIEIITIELVYLIYHVACCHMIDIKIKNNFTNMKNFPCFKRSWSIFHSHLQNPTVCRNYSNLPKSVLKKGSPDLRALSGLKINLSMLQNQRRKSNLSVLRRHFSTASQTHYSVLELSQEASPEEIKTAFKTLTKKYHPDNNSQKPESERKELEKKYKLILEAYHILGDLDRRQAYDRDTLGVKSRKKPGNAGKGVPDPEPEDPLLKWMREKYARQAEDDDPYVPPHVGFF